MILRLTGLGGAKRRDPARAEATKAAVRAALGLSGDTALSINEITCPDPDCPVLETVILIMEPGRKTRAVKLHGSIGDLAGEELRRAIEAAPKG